jgi:hypothetical protein
LFALEGRAENFCGIEIVRKGPRFEHSLPIIRSETLELCSPGSTSTLAKDRRFRLVEHRTYFGTRLALDAGSTQGFPSTDVLDEPHRDVPGE